MSTRTAKRQGPGSGAAKATTGNCPDIKVPTNPKHVNAKRQKEQDMAGVRRTDITPGDLDDRARGWYAKRAAPDSPSRIGFMRRLFG